MIAGTKPKDLWLDHSLDPAARAALEAEVFGKRVLVTDRFEWALDEVVAAYRSQRQVESAFRQLKDPGCVAVAPGFHRTDQKITVHLLCCVLALCVLRLMVREVRRDGLDMSADDLLDELERIQETVVVHRSTRGAPRGSPRAHRDGRHRSAPRPALRSRGLLPGWLGNTPRPDQQGAELGRLAFSPGQPGQPGHSR